MGNIGPGPRVRRTIGRTALLAPCLAASLAGCAHRDVVDTPVGWWHQLQGGAIAEQRPPPPGLNDPYPQIGTTPERPPAVASLDLRHSVTTALLRQRNLTARLDANDPIPEAVARPAPRPQAPPQPAAAGGSSAMLDAAQAPPGPAARAAASATDAEPELAMPAVQVQAADVSGGPVTMPAIPGAPPPPPRLPGVAISADLPDPRQPASRRLPDYRVVPLAGTSVAFAPGTDTMLGGQMPALHAIAARRGAGALLVRGYGDAAAPDPDSQAQALSVAALRARSVAEALQSDGVPAGSIRIRAEAFGRGASVSLLQ